MSSHIEYFNLSAVIGYAGATMIIFEGNNCVLVIRHQMKNPEKFKSILIGGTVAVFLTYMLLGTVIYLTYRETTMEIFTQNFNPLTAVTAIANLLIALNTLFSYPL